MAHNWLIAAVVMPGMLLAAASSNAQDPAAGPQPASDEATCGTADECMEEGIRAEVARDGDQAALDRLSYNSFVQACFFGSGLGCETAANLAVLGIGTAPSQEAFEQLQQVGCYLDNAYSCSEASKAAMEAGRKSEAWAFLAIEARLIGNRIWEMDNAFDLAPRLPDGRVVLIPATNEGLVWAPQGVNTALTCAGYWQAIAPDSPEAAGWQAAARAAFVAWPPLEGKPARTVEEADRWIGDQAVTVDTDASERNVYDRLARSRCFMGRGRLYTE